MFRLTPLALFFLLETGERLNAGLSPNFPQSHVLVA